MPGAELFRLQDPADIAPGEGLDDPLAAESIDDMYRAGVKAGDFITRIDGEQVLGLTLAEAVEKMRGPVGTTIRLTIRRASKEPFNVTITRDYFYSQAQNQIRQQGRPGRR